MNRRSAISTLSAGVAALMAGREPRSVLAQAQYSSPDGPAKPEQTRGALPSVKITDVKTYRLGVRNQNLCVVKVLTSEAGLYGVGCGTHAERTLIVADTIENFVKPFVVGRNADEIEKIWQELWVAPYWRASVDANNAMAAVDAALWDIAGKRAGMPVYDLLGGKVRNGLRVLRNVQAADPSKLEDSIRAAMADGYDHFRIYVGGSGDGEGGTPLNAPANSANTRARDSDTKYIDQVCKAFELVRNKIGFDIEIGTDVHERPSPQAALALAKAVEPYRPFWMEDLFAPEDVEWYRVVRQQSSIGIAMGELFVNQNEWLPLVSGRLIDYMRMHISAAGGLSLARKVAHCCEFYGVRTAWHGPANVSPIGHAVNLHIDLASYNFGICEGGDFNDAYKELFPGCPEIRKGLRYDNGQPGLGIDIDEKLIAKYPPLGNGSNRGGHDMDGGPIRP